MNGAKWNGRIAALALGVASATAAAADFQDAMDAYQRGDHDVAIREWRILAAQGDEMAQYNLGVMYEQGQGSRVNYGQAARWYGAAAVQGQAEAQFALGQLYETGRGIRRNAHEAFGWYLKAAKQGDKRAQNKLGLMYQRGEGIAKDPVSAYAWFQIAAKQSHHNAKLNRKRVGNRMLASDRYRAEQLSQVYYERFVVPFN